MTKETISVDSCVIGSGINGLWTALELAKKGQKVLLIDKTHIGHSKQSIDVCLSYTCDNKLYDLALKAQKKWFSLNKNFGSELNIELRGSLSFALNKEEMQYLEKTLMLQKECSNDLGSFIIKDRQALKALMKARDLGDSVRSALISVEDMSVDHNACVELLRKKIIQQGVKFWGSDEVINFELEGDSIKSVSTKEATVEAKNFVLATGAKSADLLEKLDLHMPIRPSRAHIIEYTSKMQLPKQILHYKTKFGDFICKPMLNGRNHLIYTGIDDQMQATWSKQINQQTIISGFVEMMRIMPALEYVDIQNSHIVQLAITPDRLPYFGKTKFYKNLYMNIGFCGSKYLFVPLFSEKLAESIVKGQKILDDDFDFVNPDRLSPKDYTIDYDEVNSKNISIGEELSHEHDSSTNTLTEENKQNELNEQSDTTQIPEAK